MAFPIVGQTLYIEQEGMRHRGHARLLDSSESALYIDAPMMLGGSILLPVDESLPLRITYRTSKGGLYYFDATLLGRDRLGQLACMRIARPTLTDIVRIQRRAFARVEVPIDLSILCIREERTPRLLTARATTRDISGGGLSFFTPRPLDIHKADPVTVKFAIADDAGQTHPISAKGEITRIATDDDQRTVYSMKFTDIATAVQQRIVKYVFRLQLRERAFREE